MPQYHQVLASPGNGTYVPNDNAQSPYGLGMQRYGSIIILFPLAQIPSLISNGLNRPPIIFSHNRSSLSSQYSGLPSTLMNESEAVGSTTSTAIDGRHEENVNVWNSGYPQPLKFVSIA